MRARGTVAWTVGLALVAAAGPARADRSYGWQLGVSDGVSDALTASIFWTTATEQLHGWNFYVGVAGTVIGGPAIHAAHGDWRGAGASLGARVMLPLGGMWLGSATCNKRSHGLDLFPCLGPVLLGTAIGMVGAQVIDWTLIDHTVADPTPLMFRLGGRF